MAHASSTEGPAFTAQYADYSFALGTGTNTRQLAAEKAAANLNMGMLDEVATAPDTVEMKVVG